MAAGSRDGGEEKMEECLIPHLSSRSLVGEGGEEREREERKEKRRTVVVQRLVVSPDTV